MSDVDGTATAEQVSTSPKKSGKSKAASAAAKKVRAKPSHPKTADMVNAAIVGLKERKGSSLHAIKKYISTNYKVDADKMAIFIRKYLKSAVTSGSLVQTKGKGASGSFKMATVATEKKTIKKAAKPKSPKPKSSTKAKKEKAAARKPASPKKTASKKASTPKAAPAKSKPSAAKSKTANRSPTKKPKAPKPKKATASKPKASPKKAPKKK